MTPLRRCQLQVLRIASEEAVNLAAKLPPGRIFASGRRFGTRPVRAALSEKRDRLRS